jgi:Arc/MetJ-type ribon-helix-helix transcriptional regulator
MPTTNQSKVPVPLRLPEAVVAALDTLAEQGIHGSNRSEVARYLIVRGLDELRGLGCFQIDR